MASLSNNKIVNAAARSSEQQVGNAMRNQFPENKQIRKGDEYPQNVHLVPDIFIVIHKITFDYEKKINGTSPSGAIQDVPLTSGKNDTQQDLALVANLSFHDVYQINDAREVRTSMSNGKTQGSATFSIADKLIKEKKIFSEFGIKDPSGGVSFFPNELPPEDNKFDDPNVVIDVMDIIKVFQKNRFDDKYTVTFTGFITKINQSDLAKGDTVYSYTCADVSTALRLSQTVVSPSLAQLIRKGSLDPKLQENIAFENPLQADQDGIKIIRRVIDGAWFIYPQTSQLKAESKIPQNQTLTRIEVQQPRSLGILDVLTFPSNFEGIRSYGLAFGNFSQISVYQWRGKFPIDIIRDIASVSGFEFYATPEGNFYYGMPRWDLDIDGAVYRKNKNDGAIERVGFYNSTGELDPGPLAKDLGEPQNTQIYVIGPEDILTYDEDFSIDNIYTRVEMAPITFSDDIKSQFMKSGNDQLFFHFPDFNFDLESLKNLDLESEEFLDFTRYGYKPYKVDAKPFLKTAPAILAFAEYTYNFLKANRRTGSLKIPFRPELLAGRTIRVPSKNIIAYVDSVTHSFIPKKSATTSLGLKFIRASDVVTNDLPPRYKRATGYISTPIENQYGLFVPAGTFDYTALAAKA